MRTPHAASGELRSPLVCGALGRYDPARVRRMAAAFDRDVRVVHEDATSALAMDREPIRWGGGSGAGLGWIDALPWGGVASGWEEASQAGACGLLLEGRHRRVHSSVNGLGAVYWMSEGGALYFASRIDPLVQAATGPLSIDWDAWSSIIAMRFPGADRTPFAEIRRLPPYAALGWRRRRPRIESPTWPWTRTEPHLAAREAGEVLAQSLRDTAAAVGRPTLVPLSGGRDSRLLACAFAEAGFAARAVSVGDDEGGTFEEDLAAPVAAALGLERDVLRPAAANYPRNWLTRARLVEYQFADHAWLVPLSRHLAQQTLPVSDGFAIDALLGRGSRFFTPATLDGSDPRRASLALFDSMRRYGQAHRALAEHLREPAVARARDLFIEVAEEFEGHHSQATLIFYRTRTVRGIACYPTGLLGQRASIVAPAASLDFALATLSATGAARADDGLYRATFEALAPAVGRLPSTTDTPRPVPHRPRLWCADPAVAAHRERLAHGPLAGLVAPELTAWLDDSPRPGLDPDLRMGLEGISLLHAWWQRYRGQLREVDVKDLVG